MYHIIVASLKFLCFCQILELLRQCGIYCVSVRFQNCYDGVVFLCFCQILDLQKHKHTTLRQCGMFVFLSDYRIATIVWYFVFLSDFRLATMEWYFCVSVRFQNCYDTSMEWYFCVSVRFQDCYDGAWYFCVSVRFQDLLRQCGIFVFLSDFRLATTETQKSDFRLATIVWYVCVSVRFQTCYDSVVCLCFCQILDLLRQCGMFVFLSDFSVRFQTCYDKRGMFVFLSDFRLATIVWYVCVSVRFQTCYDSVVGLCKICCDFCQILGLLRQRGIFVFLSDFRT